MQSSGNTSTLDKFKRRLIRTIARSLLQEKLPEKEIWTKLSAETGCDCELLWKRMRSLTLKKLKRLLPADDKNDSIPVIARMSVNDWLYFDLFLVHEKLDFIGQDKLKSSKTEYRPLMELFSLVQKFDIENRKGQDLAGAWAAATAYYNTQGRLSSPMMLQRRWYQLKELTRNIFYDFWFSNRGNTKLMEKSKTCPTVLQSAIARRFPHVVTQPFHEWETLIQQELVILPEAFETKFNGTILPKPQEQSPDLIIVEPVIETIDLGIDSDTDMNSNDASDIEQTVMQSIDTDTNKTKIDLPRVKTEPIEMDIDEMEVNSDVPEQSNIQETDKIGPERDIFEKIVELDQNIDKELEESTELLPQITSVYGNIDIDKVNFTDSEVDTIEPPIPTTETTEDINLDLDDSNILSSPEVMKTDVKIISSPEGITTNVNLISSPESITTDVNIISSPEVMTTDVNIINSDETEKLNEECINNDTAFDIFNPFGEIPTDLNLADDGIEFKDESVEYGNDKDEKHEDSVAPTLETVNVAKDEEGKGDEEILEKSDEIPNIDPKLLMYPIVYTTKLDHMDIFNSNDYSIANDKSLIEKVCLISKPNVMKNKKQIKQEKDVIPENKKVKLTSCLLQKPRSRSYNPIQLCKNPDFNTRLKRLTVGFFSYTRNRQLLKACKPMTIDLCKAFESKLIDGTVYLKASTEIKKEITIDDKESNQTSTVLPSAMVVQSLMNNTVVNINNLPKFNSGISDIQIQTVKSEANNVTSILDNYKKHYEEDTAVSERSRVINLPDILEIRRINQRLLTAEVSPIRVQSDNSCKPPVHLVPTDNNECNKFKDNNIGVLNNVNTVINNQNSKETIPRIALDNDIKNEKVEDKPPTPLTGCASSGSNTVVLESNAKTLLPKTSNDTTNKTTKCITAHDASKGKNKFREVTPLWQKAKKISFNAYASAKSVTAPWITNTNNSSNDAAPINESLLTSDALNKMLGLFCSDIITNKSKKKRNSKATNPVPDVINDLTVAQVTSSSKERDVNTGVKKQKPQKQSKKNTNTSSQTLLKVRVFSADPKNGKRSNFCCWAREKLIFRGTRKLSTHKCRPPICKCCCRDELIDLVTNKSKTITNIPGPARFNLAASSTTDAKQTPIVLSDDEDNVSIQESIDNVMGSSPENDVMSTKTTVCNEIGESVLSSETSVSNAITNSSMSSVITITDDTRENIVSTSSQIEGMIAPTMTPVPNNTSTTTVSTVSSKILNTDKNTCDISTNTTISPEQRESYVIDTSLIKPSDRTKIIKNKFNKPKETTIENNGTCSTPNSVLENCRQNIVIDGSSTYSSNFLQKKRTKANAERILFLSSKHISNMPSESPIRLGKNKILLSTVKYPGNTESYTSCKIKDSKIFSSTMAIPTVALPKGVQIVLLPNNQLSYTVDPGVALSKKDLDCLAPIMAAIQIQTQAIISNIAEMQQNLISTVQSNLIPTTILDEDKPAAVGDQISTVVNTDQTGVEVPTPQIIDDICQEKDVTSDFNQININQATKTASVQSDETNLTKSNEQETTSKAGSDQVNVISNVEKPSNISESQEEVNDMVEVPMQENNDSNCDNSETTNPTNDTNSACEVVNETSQTITNRKSLLSDLMEMSGISAEDTRPGLDTTIEKEPENVPTNLSNEGHLPLLYPISSFIELKYACENNAQFFKLDCVTNVVVPINVCIKKNAQPKKPEPPKVVKSVIDLTDDGEAEKESVSTVKPVSLIKSYVAPSILKKCGTIHVTDVNHSKKYKIRSMETNTRSLLKHPIAANSISVSSTSKSTSNRRKQVLSNKDTIYKEEKEWLMSDNDSKNAPSKKNKEESDDSSDEEPLAKKVKRRELSNTNETANSAQSNENSKDITEESAQENLNLTNESEMTPQCNSEYDPEQMNSGESDGDCILGF